MNLKVYGLRGTATSVASTQAGASLTLPATDNKETIAKISHFTLLQAGNCDMIDAHLVT
jgi:hypothetical protein